MTKRMLIDATHAEETRVVVLDGNRLEDFDVETSTKRQLKGNIYLAKVVRVEPSLQAAFVEYGGNRHGFLAFSEIHPDYYQIPVADRQRLLDMQAEDARREEEEEDLELALSQATEGQHDDTPPAPAPVREVNAREGQGRDGQGRRSGRNRHGHDRGAADRAASDRAAPAAAEPTAESWAYPSTPLLTAAEIVASPESGTGTVNPEQVAAAWHDAAEATQAPVTEPEAWAKPDLPPLLLDAASETPAPVSEQSPGESFVEAPSGETQTREAQSEEAPSASYDSGRAEGGSSSARALRIETESVSEAAHTPANDDDHDSYEGDSFDQIEAGPPPETVGGRDQDSSEDRGERRMPPRFLRNYKIQEVIRRRQILLIQVVKEERGTKGAALTTYLSLAGRFGVLMPNSPRGGGISRKITSATDRRRLKEVMSELDIPRGMGMIVRTAGANRPKPEIKRDCEYLLRLWDDIREQTLKSVAPALIYEEASLIKRAIRDVYSRDIDEIQVDGEEGWRAAHEFMRMLMPSHAKKVQLWRDGGQPLFAKHMVEAQLDAMLVPTVQLRSGGYLVINQAEALVAIDVNSGRSTRERNIEETALRTNLEAADEVARQLRLRDLAGLIVIDFIDMESKRHNAMVERRIKDALKNDRARIQVGSISHFGLLEMSRQRLRPSLAETSFIACPHCGGTGHVRSTESAAIHVLRGIEDEGGKRRTAEIIVHLATPIALYLLNHKRERLREIESRYAMRVIIAADDEQIAPQFRIERVRMRSADEIPPIVTPERMLAPPIAEFEPEEEPDVVSSDEEEDDGGEEDTEEQRAADAANGITSEEADRRRKRRRRRRRGGRREDQPGFVADDVSEGAADVAAGGAAASSDAVADGEAASSTVRAADEGEDLAASAEAPVADASDSSETAPQGDDDPRNRRRGRRGGRRRRSGGEGEMSPFALPGAEQPDLVPVYAGPTPADPFGGRVFDIFDVMDQVERAAEARPAARAAAIENTGAPEAAVRFVESPAEMASAAPADEQHDVPGQPVMAAESTVADAGIVNEPAAEPEAHMAITAEPETAYAEPFVAAEAIVATAEMSAAAAEHADDMSQPATAASDTASVDGLAAVALPEPVPMVQAAEQAVAAIADEPQVVVETAATETADAEPPPPSPAIKPIVIGAGGEPPAEPKRGWWRR